MYEQFGFGVDSNGRHRFQLFIPDNTVDPSQYTGTHPCLIEQVEVVGDFLPSLTNDPSANWNPTKALTMQRVPNPHGILFEAILPQNLKEGFYQYKYIVTFQNGTKRWIADPCAKHCGKRDGNSGFVVGGPLLRPATPLGGLILQDAIIYELMVDDFTRNYRGQEPPLAAVWQQLRLLIGPYGKIPNINAVELMPMTAYPDNEPFSWGYDPVYLFALEDHYVSPGTPTERRVRLQTLVEKCHERGVRVLLDIVLQHVNCTDSGMSFPYYWLWQNLDSPFIGQFTNQPTFGMQPLEYDNACVLQFTADVCCYWLETFGLDGLRFDQTSGYYNTNDLKDGLPALIAEVRRRSSAAGRPDPILVLEDTWDYTAINRANAAQASGCWLEPYRGELANAVSGQLDTNIMRALNANECFAPGTEPCIYIENHDHSSIVSIAGGPDNWFRTQPAVIALFTSPGGVLLHNGQELGWNVFLLDDDSNAPLSQQRVQPRPLPWLQLIGPVSVRLTELYRKLSDIRANHPALRGPNFYPSNYDSNNSEFDSQGYGVSLSRQLVIYHRWGPSKQGANERFMMVLNFGDGDQSVDVPLPLDGPWTDLLNPGFIANCSNGRALGVAVPSHWGRILMKVG